MLSGEIQIIFSGESQSEVPRTDATVTLKVHSCELYKCICSFCSLSLSITRWRSPAPCARNAKTKGRATAECVPSHTFAQDSTVTDTTIRVRVTRLTFNKSHGCPAVARGRAVTRVNTVVSSHEQRRPTYSTRRGAAPHTTCGNSCGYGLTIAGSFCE